VEISVPSISNKMASGPVVASGSSGLIPQRTRR
jgi:hypothetical protein